MKKSFIIPVIILAIIGASGFWYYSKINTIQQERLRRREETRQTRLNAILERNKEEQQVLQEEKFDKKYTVIYEEDLSSPQVRKYVQHIHVPLGLSSKDLKLNLEHAAKTLKRTKNADTVFIFAYRQDDRKHESDYTAGRYVIAPNIPDTFDTAEVYMKTKKIYPAASEAIINKDNVKLYSKHDFEPSDVVKTLRKGTEIMIIDHYRDFVITDIVDIYKVLIWPHKNKKSQYTGWIMDNDFTLVSNKNKTEQKKKVEKTSNPVVVKSPEPFNFTITKKSVKTKSNKKTQPDYFKYISQQEKNKIHELINSYNFKKLNASLSLVYWKNSGHEIKLATCGAYVGFALSEDILSKAILSTRDLNNMAESIINRLDYSISGFVDEQLSKYTIGETVFRIMYSLDLLKYPLIN